MLFTSERYFEKYKHKFHNYGVWFGQGRKMVLIRPSSRLKVTSGEKERINLQTLSPSFQNSFKHKKVSHRPLHLLKYLEIVFKLFKATTKVYYGTVNELTGAPRHRINNNELKMEDNLSWGQCWERLWINCNDPAGTTLLISLQNWINQKIELQLFRISRKLYFNYATLFDIWKVMKNQVYFCTEF